MTAAGIFQLQLFAAEGKVVFYENLGFAARPDERPGMQDRVAATSPPCPSCPVVPIT
jgi:hypothetical protein